MGEIGPRSTLEWQVDAAAQLPTVNALWRLVKLYEECHSSFFNNTLRAFLEPDNHALSTSFSNCFLRLSDGR